MKRHLIPVAAAAAVALAGGATAFAHSLTSQTSAHSARPVPHAKAKVSISSYAFHPAVLRIKVGTTVVWTNRDNDNHTVTVNSGSGPQSGTLSHKGTFRFTFKHAGTFSYHCAYHAYMHAKVVVK